MSLSDALATNIKEKEDTARQLGAAGSESSVFNIVSPNTVSPRHAYTIHSTRELGSSFVLGLEHRNPGGVGAGGVLGSVVASGINFLGDAAVEDWTVLTVMSPNNTFIETFVGSRFKDHTNTTALWTNTGSVTL